MPKDCKPGDFKTPGPELILRNISDLQFLQPGVDLENEVPSKKEKIKKAKDDPKAWDGLLRDHVVPLVLWSPGKLYDKDTLMLGFDRSHETRALYEFGQNHPGDKRFKQVYTSVQLKLSGITAEQRNHILYLNGKVFPFVDKSRFMNKDGLFIPYDSVDKNIWKGVPRPVEKFENSFDRGFGAVLRDALDLSHHIVFLEFRLAQAAKVRWGVTEEDIEKDLKNAVEAAAERACKDKEFIERRILCDQIEFQK